MHNSKEIMQKRLRVVLVLLCLITGFQNVSEVHAANDQTSEQVVSTNGDLSGFQQATSNSYIALYVNPKTLGIKVQDRASQYMWSSVIDDANDSGLNLSWRKFANSGITIDYLDRTQKIRRETISDQARVNLRKTKNGFTATVNFRSMISLQVVAELKGNQLSISIPKQSIRETPYNKLVDVYAYPFLGATKEASIPGYMVIPDGSGALIDLQQTQRLMTTPYVGHIYGTDIGLDNSDSTDAESIDVGNPIKQVIMPAYGIVHGINQHGLLTEVTKGAEYGDITAYKAGLITPFNWITTAFNYRRSYQQLTSRSDTSGVTMYQKKANKFTIQSRYTFLSGDQANYVGMAKSLQRDLIQGKVLARTAATHQLMNLNYLGADGEQGLFGNKVTTVTTLANMRTDVTKIAKNNITNVLTTVTGFNKGGAAERFATQFPLNNTVGGTGDYVQTAKALIRVKDQLGVDLQYGQVAEKNNRSNIELAQSATGQLITQDGLRYLQPNSFVTAIASDLSQLKDMGIKTVTVENMGHLLYSTYNEGEEFNRQTAIDQIRRGVRKLTKNNVTVQMQAPNSYLWSYIQGMTDIPMTSSGFTYTTEDVPFLQIVLSGHLPYYESARNQSSNQQNDLLRMIDYGSLPKFTLTQKSTYLLKDTSSRDLFSTRFKDWQKTIDKNYRAVVKLQKATNQTGIKTRTVLPNGLVRVTYENGAVVRVNYGAKAANDGTHEVGARNFTISAGGKS